MKGLAVVMFCFMAAACGAGQANRLSPAGHADPVSATRGTRALFAPARQFVSYVPAAQRLSVIDQATETESFGIDFYADVKAAFPISRFDGIAALTSNGLTVFSSGLKRSFDFAAVGNSWDLASEAPAMAFSSAGGMRVIRQLDGDAWQNEDLSGLEPSANATPVMNSDGTLLVAIESDRGSYVVYRADKETEKMTSRLACVNDTVLPTSIVAFAMVGTRIFWGDAEGKLGTIDVGAASCQQIVATATVEGGAEIARVVPKSDDSLLVFTIGGGIFEWDGKENINSYVSLGNCDFPLSPTLLEGEGISALCLNDLDSSSNSRTVVYNSASYNFYFKGKSRSDFELDLTLANVSTLGVDAISKRLFVLSASALGRLTVVELTTGLLHEHQGIFMRGVLQR